MNGFARWTAVICGAGLLWLGCATLISAEKSKFTTSDKAYYADERTVSFVRPGLVIKILAAEVAADGKITTRVRFTDPRGLPLDKDGIETPGAIRAGAPGMLIAYIPRNGAKYENYITRNATDAATGEVASQATSENNGTWKKVAAGEYDYTFRFVLPSGFDRTATHTVGVFGIRDLREFDLSIDEADAVFHFVPDGSKPQQTPEVIKTQTCRKCHDNMRFDTHTRSGRISVEMCVLCHNPKSFDPNGESLDMGVMIHRIHMNSSLPSVVAGAKFGYRGKDYSKILYSANKRDCAVCHETTTGAAQADFAETKPTRNACGSCHDNVNFATGENHANLPQVSDGQCATCHFVQGELEFDLSIRGAHTVATKSKELPGTTFEILEVNDGAPGKNPTVTFSLKDKAGTPILPSEMTNLSLILSGPSTDFGGQVSEDVRTAQGSNGVYFWTFARALPATATGSFAVGIEGVRNVTLLKGTKKEQVVRDAGVNNVFTFAVTDAKAAPRRAVVSTAKCNSCHGELSLHSGRRNTVEQCVLCHNPPMTDAARRPAAAGPAVSIDFRTMIHKIHAGKSLENDYTVWASSAHPYNAVAFPGNLAKCTTCHVNNSEQLPLPATAVKVVDPSAYLTTQGPETASCTSCHDSRAAAAHAQVNSTALGESCSTCHGPDSRFSVNRVHSQ